MEERVEETMSTCDMNVLLTESNSVALVEATAQRVDLFEQQFHRRLDLIEDESGPLQRVENRLQEVHELAKGERAASTSHSPILSSSDVYHVPALIEQLAIARRQRNTAQAHRRARHRCGGAQGEGDRCDGGRAQDQGGAGRRGHARLAAGVGTGGEQDD
jgi:hypothetical protein